MSWCIRSIGPCQGSGARAALVDTAICRFGVTVASPACTRRVSVQILTGGSIGVAYSDSLGVHALVSRASLLQSDLPVQIRRPQGHRRGDSYVVPELSQWFLKNVTVVFGERDSRFLGL